MVGLGNGDQREFFFDPFPGVIQGTGEQVTVLETVENQHWTLDRTFKGLCQLVGLAWVISLVVIPSTITLILESKFLALEKSRFLLISRMTSVGILILGFISLGPVYGVIGLAVSLILSNSFQSIFLYVISKKMKDVSSMNSE